MYRNGKQPPTPPQNFGIFRVGSKGCTRVCFIETAEGCGSSRVLDLTDPEPQARALTFLFVTTNDKEQAGI